MRFSRLSLSRSSGMLLASAATIAIIVTALSAVSAWSSPGTAEADHGAPEKKLFSGRWDKPVSGGDFDAWMNLTTSALFLNCDGGGQACATKWQGPAQAAVDDWNAQNTTVFLDLQPGQSDTHDVQIIIDDEVVGDPSLLGLAVFYDENVNECDPDFCNWRFADAVAGDDAHTGIYDGPLDRQGTVAHEIGHVLALRHESVNADESIEFECGMDDGGPIPHSVMSYNCIDPVASGGLSEVLVQEWDVCGVNHAFFDPTIGLAGCAGAETPAPSASVTSSATPCCTATPTPTPTTTPIVVVAKGDNDCDGDTDAVDALKGLQKVAGLSPSQEPGCPQLDSQFASIFGDIDCDDDLDSVDALFLLRFLAALGVNLPPGCLSIGTLLTPGNPTATPAPSSSVAPTVSPGLTATPTPTPAATPMGSATPAPTSAPTPGPGQIATRNSTWYIGITGSLNVVGEVVNGLGVQVALVRIDANFYSASNQLLGTDFAFSCLDAIPAGGDSPFRSVMLDPPSGVDHVTLAVTNFLELPSTGFDPAPVGLQVNVTDFFLDGINFMNLDGTVTNNSSNNYGFVKVCGAFYDASGNVVREPLAFSSPLDLGPGQSGTFSAATDTVGITITDYRVWPDANYD